MQIALLVTAIYLVLSHLLPWLDVRFEGDSTVYAVLRLVAGLLLVLHVRATRQRQWGLVLIGLFYLCTALMGLLGEGSYALLQVLHVVAAIGAILLIIGRKRYAGLQLAYLVFGIYVLLGVAFFFASDLRFEGSGYVFSVLGIAAGVLMVLRR